MKEIKIRIFHTGRVCVAPALPFGGEDKNPLKMSPIMVRKKDRLWLPVSSYLIEHPKGKILVDCDHVNGLGLVKEAKRILVSKDELAGSMKNARKNKIRYQSK